MDGAALGFFAGVVVCFCGTECARGLDGAALGFFAGVGVRFCVTACAAMGWAVLVIFLLVFELVGANRSDWGL